MAYSTWNNMKNICNKKKEKLDNSGKAKKNCRSSTEKGAKTSPWWGRGSEIKIYKVSSG